MQRDFGARFLRASPISFAGRAANPKLSKASILLWPWVGSVFTSNMNVYIKTFLEYSGGGWGVALEIGPYFVFGVCGVSTMLQVVSPVPTAAAHAKRHH
jgi:hypothetical protein